MLKLVQTVVILWYILDDIQWISYVLYIDIDIVCPWYSNIDIDDIPIHHSQLLSTPAPLPYGSFPLNAKENHRKLPITVNEICQEQEYIIFWMGIKSEKYLLRYSGQLATLHGKNLTISKMEIDQLQNPLNWSLVGFVQS